MAIQTIKFSEFNDGGDLSNDLTTVGLDATETVNTRFNNPWTFLPPGTTGDRPVPVASIYYRLRFNTTLEVYEYYDPTVLLWVQLSGSGTGTVNPGNANDLAFYAAAGTAISPINGAANSVLVTDASEVPSLSTTLPSGLAIPGATITASTAALLSGSIVAAPVAGTDLVNKTYVDSLVAAGVTSITGTTNQVIASSPTGNVTLSLPQDIATGSTPTFAGMTLTAIPLSVSSGGSGIDNATPYAVICGGTTSTSPFQSIASVGSAGQVLTSNGAGALPTFQNASGSVNAGTANQIAYYATTGTTISGLTGANSSMLVTDATGVPAMTASMTDGQLIIGSTGATPTPSTLTAGPGISIANGAASITISGTGSGIGWTEVTGTTQAMSADSGYVANNGATVVFTLPVTAAFGTVVNVVGKGAGGWQIDQNAGQNIQLGAVSSTVGAGGSIASTNRFDSIELLCTTADTTWTCIGGPQGNITIV